MIPYCNSSYPLKIKPKKGRALLFYNMAPNLKDQVLWHGSCPVVSGEKWIAQRWFTNYPIPQAVEVWGIPRIPQLYPQ